MPDYVPRFFNRQDFEGVVAIIETLIDTGGDPPIDLELTAAQLDAFLAEIDAPALEALRLAIDAIDSWYIPLLLSFKFGRFSKLPLKDRRKIVERIIKPKGLFKVVAFAKAGARDAARTLKLIASVAYYNTTDGMARVGYLAVEQRARFASIDQSPLTFPDPFPKPTNS